ncbi:MAG: penicillin-binding protein 1A [Gammaproteobacteria bacterium]|nr:penicillin-binding protein 1A [Gammaproteobacteria bacterium]
MAIKRKIPFQKRFRPFRFLAKLILVSIIIISCVSYLIIKDIQEKLPTVTVLKDIQLQTPLRIFSADNKLMAEFGEKRRIPISLEEIPKNLINAVIATEDSRFYDHSGVDLIGLARAALKLIVSGDKAQGGSTITMQVARNFFLSREKTYLRKLNEILLARKIESELSKDEILTLYLNKIFFGYRSYGVAAAAKTYYGKAIQDLTLAESAMLAGIPKAPSAINPLSNPKAALMRRDHVLTRMLHYGYIIEDEYTKAVNQPETALHHEVNVELNAPYVTEMVRMALLKRWGDDIYTSGLQIHTTIDSRLQNYANLAVKRAIIQYEQRHGYAGPITNWGSSINTAMSQWPAQLRALNHGATNNTNNLEIAAVIQLNDSNNTFSEDSNNRLNYVKAITSTQRIITIPWEGLSWARKRTHELGAIGLLGRRPVVSSDVLRVGDVIKVWQDPDNNQWTLSQDPEIEAAIVAIDPKTGKLLAISGGYDFNKSKFNRVTQAFRQAGSSLKPFIYSAALEKGYTAASIFNDAPIVINDPEQEALWRPQNSTQEFYGPTRLRTALVKSRNLVSIRLLQEVGIDYAHDYLQKFGFNAAQIPNTLSLALGTASVTPLQLAQAFSIFANGGYAVNPTIISKITNGNEAVIYELKEIPSKLDPQFDPQFNPKLNLNLDSTTEPELAVNNNIKNNIEDNFESFGSNNHFKQIISPQNAYLINNILQDAIKSGTGKKALELNRTDLAGKTGTSNDNLDAWYCGFNPSLVTITWMGYDQPKSIYEYAATTALPMWIDFMSKALKNRPEEYLPMPSGMLSVRIDPKTGLLADSKQKDSIFELFKEGTEPTEISSYNAGDGTGGKINSGFNSAEQIF